MKNTITLITGGASSGKTSYALELSSSHSHKIYIATAEVTDDEMQLKVDKHKAERDATFTTIESPVALHTALASTAGKAPVVLIDCITFWINNLMYYEKDLAHYSTLFLKQLRQSDSDIIIVTNEVGVGIIPYDATTRAYARNVAQLNRQIAATADHVYMMVAGIPMTVK